MKNKRLIGLTASDRRERMNLYMEAAVDKISRNGGIYDLVDGFAGKDRFMCSIESLIRKKMEQYKIEMADDVVNAGRFDQRTTQEERRSTLETLLHDEERHRETVHSVPSLQEVNRMIARSEEIGSSGSSSASQRLVRMASPSLASQKLGSLSALDARSNDVSKTMPDELEEGEIVVLGDSRMDIEQSGSSFHDHEDDDGERVLQRKIKRKRSTRIRPGHTVKRLREKHEKPSLQLGDSSPLAFLADHKIESRLRAYPRLKTHRKPVAVKHHPIDSATSSKVNVLPNPEFELHVSGFRE